jgi:hemolysin activation/secretion protein
MARLAGAALCILSVIAVFPAEAQAPKLGSQGGVGDPGSAQRALPQLTPGGAPIAPPLRLPDLPPAPNSEPPLLSRGLGVFVREVQVEGNTVLPDQVLGEIVEPFLNRELSTGDLEELRRRLTLAYVERGYINSGAMLPDQEVRDGIVSYRVVEGHLTDIEVEGLGRLDERYVRNRLAQGAGPPLNTERLQERLQILLQDPLIDRMNVEIQPGLLPGEATLRAIVTRADPVSAYATVANNQAPNVGGIRGEVGTTIRNVTGWGDALAIRYGRSEGVNDGGASFVVPVAYYDTLLSARYDRNGAAVVSESLRDLDIRSNVETIGIGISQPVYRTPQRSFSLGLAFERRRSETSLLGEPFSFTPGTVDGKATVSVLRFTQDFADRTADDAFVVRSTFSFGLDVLGATVTPQKPNGEFATWLGQAQYVRQFHQEIQLLLRADAQLSRDPLFPLEQIAIGGLNTVRGYRENELIRDNAVLLSAEARIPVLRFTVDALPVRGRDNVVRVAPFVDWGRGWNKQQPTPQPRDISSIGVGLLWDIGDIATAQLYFGRALRHIRHSDRDVQDNGVHFRLTTRLW